MLELPLIGCIARDHCILKDCADSKRLFIGNVIAEEEGTLAEPREDEDTVAEDVVAKGHTVNFSIKE